MNKLDLNINISLDKDEVLGQISIEEFVQYNGEEVVNYIVDIDPMVIDFEKVTDATYDKLINVIEKKKINLELLIGKLTMKNYTDIANSKLNMGI